LTAAQLLGVFLVKGEGEVGAEKLRVAADSSESWSCRTVGPSVLWANKGTVTTVGVPDCSWPSPQCAP